jgi:hypothetical protein
VKLSTQVWETDACADSKVKTHISDHMTTLTQVLIYLLQWYGSGKTFLKKDTSFNAELNSLQSCVSFLLVSLLQVFSCEQNGDKQRKLGWTLFRSAPFRANWRHHLTICVTQCRIEFSTRWYIDFWSSIPGSIFSEGHRIFETPCTNISTLRLGFFTHLYWFRFVYILYSD